MRIEKKDAFEVFGIERIFKTSKLNKVPQFWQECHKNGSYEKLFNDAGGRDAAGEDGCLINAMCGYRQTGKNTVPYMIFAKKTEISRTEGYIIIEVPASEWAVFRSYSGCGDAISQIPELMKQAYKELPSSGYDLANGPDMEMYYGKNGNCSAVEVWIPVKKALI